MPTTERRTFTVTKFGRHLDGYFHARVVLDGHPFYTHRKFGSWFIPGKVGTREVLKEWVDHSILEALQSKARAWEKAERTRKEATQDGSKAA